MWRVIGLSSRSGFGQALANPEFRALWLADGLSVAGDQFARVALSVIVYSRTQSAAATAVVYAMTFLPTLVGGVVLGGLADRWPRRRVMVSCDIFRALLLATMAVPGVPLAVLITLLVVAVMLGSPFRAAQVATLSEVLDGAAYPAAMAIRSITAQFAQLLGFAVGGVLSALVDPYVGLAVDAATFGVSALALGVVLRSRPATTTSQPGVRHYLADLTTGATTIVREPVLRLTVAMSLLCGFYIIPEGLAAPYAAALGGGAAATGLLMAADPAGSVVGTWVFVRLFDEHRRERVMGFVAIGPGLLLALTVLSPSIQVSWVLWALSGAFSAYQVQTAVTFVNAVDNSRRGQALGLVSAAMLTAQGLGVVLAGALASALTTPAAISIIGGIGAVCGVAVAARWWRLGQQSEVVAAAAVPAV